MIDIRHIQPSGSGIHLDFLVYGVKVLNMQSLGPMWIMLVKHPSERPDAGLLLDLKGSVFLLVVVMLRRYPLVLSESRPRLIG